MRENWMTTHLHTRDTTTRGRGTAAVSRLPRGGGGQGQHGLRRRVSLSVKEGRLFHFVMDGLELFSPSLLP